MNDEILAPAVRAELQKMLDEAVAKTGIGVGSEERPMAPSDKNKQPEAGSGFVWTAKDADDLRATVADLAKQVADIAKKLPAFLQDKDGDDGVSKAETISKAAEDATTALQVAEALIGRVENLEKAAATGVRKSITGQDGGAAPSGFDGVVSTLVAGGKVRLG